MDETRCLPVGQARTFRVPDDKAAAEKLAIKATNGGLVEVCGDDVVLRFVTFANNLYVTHSLGTDIRGEERGTTLDRLVEECIVAVGDVDKDLLACGVSRVITWCSVVVIEVNEEVTNFVGSTLEERRRRQRDGLRESQGDKAQLQQEQELGGETEHDGR